MSDDVATIAAFAGSLRKGSYNRMLIRAAVELAPPGIKVVPFDIDDVPLFNDDLDSDENPLPSVKRLRDAIRSADALLIASPEYNWSIPGGLKNAVDWASRLKEVPFAGKPVALQSAATGLLGGSRMQYHLRQSLTSIEAIMFTKPEVIVTFAAKKFDEKTLELTDQPTRDMVKLQLQSFEKFVRRIAPKG